MSNQPPRRTPPRTRRAAAALRYAALGWPVLPLHTPQPDGSCSCADTACPKRGKHPRNRHGLRDASTDARRVAAWWNAWPHANIGIATGRLVVIDVDGDAGHAALAELERAHAPLPHTLTATTGRGTHLYFINAGMPRIANSAGRLAPGLDVRGHGGYVVAPPSLHADGRRYHWDKQRQPASLPHWLAELLLPATRTPAPVAPAPASTTDRSERRARYLQAALRAELASVASAAPGARNDTLNRAAFRLAQLTASGHGELDALPDQLLHAALAAGLSEDEARTTIHSALRASQQHPRPTPLAR